MAQKSWHLSRRAALKGAGVVCALPFLEGMSLDAQARQTTPPKRMCFLYFPNGCSLPEASNEEYKEWRWFPEGEGEDYRFTRVLSSLEPFRKDLSVLGGLSHPKTRELLGHIAGDTWLTAGDVRNGQYKNSISVDQVAAQHLKEFTRYPSLVFSIDGGVGYKSRTSTLSFDLAGSPIPSEFRQRDIFERYFTAGKAGSVDERRRSLQQNRKIVDLVLEDSKSLEKRLGAADKAKLDEYLSSLSAMEEQIKRNEAWLNVPLKPFNYDHVKFDVSPEIDPEAYLRSTLDLIVLAYQLDLTRVATHMLAREDAMGFGDNFPKIALGLKKGHHSISHDKSEGHWVEWGSYDQWMTSHLAYFLEKMKSTTDEYGSLLDRTMVMYGSSCSTTHDAINYPTILAGGAEMGLKHGAYTIYDEDEHVMSDLFLGMLQATDVPVESFADSTGVLPHLFA